MCPCFAGDDINRESPNWQPLLDLVPESVVEEFMWMYSTKLEDGSVVHAYKHYWTRCYVFLSEEGSCFTYCRGNRYRWADFEQELAIALRRRE